jgi:hypothetical protein
VLNEVESAEALTETEYVEFMHFMGMAEEEGSAEGAYGISMDDLLSELVMGGAGRRSLVEGGMAVGAEESGGRASGVAATEVAVEVAAEPAAAAAAAAVAAAGEGGGM